MGFTTWAASWQNQYPVKIQISLGIHPVWSESSLCAQWVAKDPSLLHSDSEVSDQTGRMVGAHAILLVLSWGGSLISMSVIQEQISFDSISCGPRQASLVLNAYASSKGSGEPAHPRSLARTSAARLYKQWAKRNLQTESLIPGPSEWLGMRS